MTSVDSNSGGMPLVQKVAMGTGIAGSVAGIAAAMNAVIAKEDRAGAKGTAALPHAWSMIAPAKVDAAALPADDAAALDTMRGAYRGKVAGFASQYHAAGREVWYSSTNPRVSDLTSVVHGRDAAIESTRQLARTSGLPGVAVSLDGERHFIGTLDKELAGGGPTYPGPGGVNSPGLPMVDFTAADNSIAAVVRADGGDPEHHGHFQLGTIKDGAVSGSRQHPGVRTQWTATGATIEAAVADTAGVAAYQLNSARTGMRTAAGLAGAALGLGALTYALATRD